MSSFTSLYLDQLKKGLLNVLNQSVPDEVLSPGSLRDYHNPEWAQHFLSGQALTMCSPAKLDNIQACVEDCLANDIPGDFIECGIWRGGAVIFMRAILAAYGVADRTVWCADSFRGLPQPEPGSVDSDEFNVTDVSRFARLAVDLETVQKNFNRYGLHDPQVAFLEGWFKDTLPAAPIERLAVLRLDGDLYESTMDILNNLYPKVSEGGYVIFDEWGSEMWGEQQAAMEYRRTHGITDKIVEVNWECSYWRKGSGS